MLRLSENSCIFYYDDVLIYFNNIKAQLKKTVKWKHSQCIFFFLVGQEKSSIHDFLVALKFRVPFEMCSMLGLGKEVLIVSVEG